MKTFSLKGGQTVHLIGDPHLGKKFEVGVASHRRGERETSQILDFIRHLDAEADIIVMVGDLFDTPFVTDGVIVSAAQAVLSAAERNTHVMYLFMAGNHDLPRNIALVGAWHAFREMTRERLPNLLIFDRPAAWGPLLLFPWQWGRRADEQIEDVRGAVGIEHAIGHWDLSTFDGKDDHLAPADTLRSVFGDIGLWSGHYHVPGLYGAVRCIGSMQPYSHGEDPSGALYVTLTREEAMSRRDLFNKNVRVLLAAGEDLPEIDCLSLTHKRVRDEAVDEITVSFDDFDFPRLVAKGIQERDPLVQSFIGERMSLNVRATEDQHGGSATTG